MMAGGREGQRRRETWHKETVELTEKRNQSCRASCHWVCPGLFNATKTLTLYIAPIKMPGVPFVQSRIESRVQGIESLHITAKPCNIWGVAKLAPRLRVCHGCGLRARQAFGRSILFGGKRADTSVGPSFWGDATTCWIASSFKPRTILNKQLSCKIQHKQGQGGGLSYNGTSHGPSPPAWGLPGGCKDSCSLHVLARTWPRKQSMTKKHGSDT